MDARKFWTACRVHDWFYMMADDPGAYRDGKENEERLREISQTSPEHLEIFIAWQSYFRDCGAKPEEPKLEETNA